MKEVTQNRQAWARLTKEHYTHYKAKLSEEKSLLNDIITGELGEISGKDLIHLQCNTGADTLSLARLGATVTGVDLVPENIEYARKLAADFDIPQASFIESDIMALMAKHHKKYDIVFTSEGAIGWLPDLKKWGQTIRHLLKDDGFFYIFESHPFFMTMDENKLADSQVVIKYPYFHQGPDRDENIGGYASAPQQATNYFWMYTIGDIVTALAEADLAIEYLHEYDKLFYRIGSMEQADKGLYHYPFFDKKVPFSFSLKATVR